MSDEELNGKLQMVYVGDRNALNELIGYYGGLKEVVELLKKENKELKTKLKEIKDKEKNKDTRNSRQRVENKKLYMKNKELKNQQKEFIEYLEDRLNMCDGFLDTIKSDLEEISYAGRVSGKAYIATQIMKNETGRKCYEEALLKYKEIIGSDKQ